MVVRGDAGAGTAVAVYLNALGGLVDAYTAQGGMNFLNGAVGIERHLVDAHRAALVVARRQVVVVVEQVPLAFVFDQAVVVGPAAVGMLGHDDALEVPRTQRTLRHGVGQCLGGVGAIARVATHPWEGEVVPVAAAEGKRAFLETVGQALHLLSAHLHRRHLRHALATWHLDFLQFSVELLHVALQLGTANAHAAPVDVGLSVVVDQHAGVNARDAFDGLWLAGVWSLGTVGRGNADGKAAPFLRGIGEEEVVAAVLEDAVGCPHGVARGVAPGNGLLRDDHSVVRPVGEVLRREHVIVGHAEPVLSLSLGRGDVVRGEQVHLIIKHARGRVGGELVANDRVLCRQGERHTQKKHTENSFHELKCY